MAMQVDHSFGGSGVIHFAELEPPEPDFASAAPAAPVAPGAPTPVAAPPAPPPVPPAPAPSNWVAELPPTAFGPPAPHPGQAPEPTVLATLAPAPAVAVIEAAPVVPVASPVAAATVATTLAAPSAPTASAMEIATLELSLADPLNQELIHHHGGALPVLDLANLNPVQQEQVDRYGADLTARLTQLAQANAAVRDLYVQAMDQAAQGLGPDTMGAVFVPGSWAGGDSDPVPDSWRFDPVVFTQAYAQGGLNDAAPVEQRAFVATFGTDALQAWEQRQGGDAEYTQRGYTLADRFELNAPTLTDLDGHPNRERMGWTGASLNPDSHALRPLSLAAPPELHNAQAVWFDATLGWVTPSENVVVKQDFFDKAIPIVFVGVMTWATAGAFGIAGGAGVATGAGIGAGGGIVGAMTAGAAFGAVGSFYGGLVNEGRIDLGSIFRGALTGAITAGVVRASGLDSMGIETGTNGQGQPIVTSIDYAQRALAVTGQATLQGALQQISGGEFVDGFTSGLAQGLGVEVARGLQLQIDTLSHAGSIDATQAGAMRQFARVAQSAVGLLGNPDDPGHAFAMTFVNGLVSDVQQGLTARELQGTGPWSAGDYRNGADIDSDNAAWDRHVAASSSNQGRSEDNYWNGRGPTIADRYAETFGGDADLVDYRTRSGEVVPTVPLTSLDVDSDRRDPSIDGSFPGEAPAGTVLGYRDKNGPYFRVFQDGNVEYIRPAGYGSSADGGFNAAEASRLSNYLAPASTEVSGLDILGPEWGGYIGQGTLGTQITASQFGAGLVDMYVRAPINLIPSLASEVVNGYVGLWNLTTGNGPQVGTFNWRPLDYSNPMAGALGEFGFGFAMPEAAAGIAALSRGSTAPRAATLPDYMLAESELLTNRQTFWPASAGFLDAPTPGALPQGYVMSRYGGYFDERGAFRDFGNFGAPAGVPYEARALPPGTLATKPLSTYEVIKPIPDVLSGRSSPWFGEVGLGLQHQLPRSFQHYLDQGYLRLIQREVPPPPMP